MSIVIVHYQPIEKYPPITNLLNYFSEVNYNEEVVVFTTNPPDNFNLFNAKSKNIIIYREPQVEKSFTIYKLIKYFFIYSKWFFKIKNIKPKSILYYETWSCMPVYFYAKTNSKTNILIHYHEYTSINEYNSSAGILKLLYKVEKKIIPKASWISHTNQKRLQLFLQNENINYNQNIHHTLPNYPSKYWANNFVLENKNINNPLKFVYIGSLGLNTMYVKEFAKFIIEQNGNATWDIYTNQFNDEAINYIKKLKTSFINIKGSINYNEIPKEIYQNNYQIGLILYNGHIDNYVYNAPNKLFEYLACGLNVWYPNVMIGCKEYKNSISNIFEIDFKENISNQMKVFLEIEKSLFHKNQNEFFYENIYNKILNRFDLTKELNN